MAAHAEDALRCPRVAQILDLPLAVATSETARTECLVTGQDGQILNLVVAGTAAVGAVVAYERAVAE